MENYKSEKMPNYGLIRTQEMVGYKEIEVNWFADEVQNENEWTGRIRGEGSDGSVWYGKGKIMRIQAGGQTTGIDITQILEKSAAKGSE
jgi:hypothetical protein